MYSFSLIIKLIGTPKCRTTEAVPKSGEKKQILNVKPDSKPTKPSAVMTVTQNDCKEMANLGKENQTKT